jgi:uncharacterized membrane protein YoaK (UPF0700 family)
LVFGVLAFGQGSQLVLSKKVGLSEFTTTVITSTLADLSSDEFILKIWKMEHLRSRLRRLISILCMLFGATVGAQIVVHRSFAVAVFVAAGISCIVAIGWAL